MLKGSMALVTLTAATAPVCYFKALIYITVIWYENWQSDVWCLTAASAQ